MQLALVAVSVVALLAAFYILWRSGLRFERVLVATFGALVGSLIGRVVVNPHSLGHLAFVTVGALLFSLVDLARIHRRRSHYRS